MWRPCLALGRLKLVLQHAIEAFNSGARGSVGCDHPAYTAMKTMESACVNALRQDLK